MKDMTNEQAKSELMQIYGMLSEEKKQALDVLMAQADGEYISRKALLEDLYKRDYTKFTHRDFVALVQYQDIVAIPSADPKKCKDCKWWRDSDGAYRRGVKAESQCPINRREVLEGNGYCYVFEPQESEINNG